MRKQLTALYHNNDDFGKIYKAITQEPVEDYKMLCGLLYYKERLCIPGNYIIRTTLLDAVHGKEAGHFSVPKTLSILERSYYWPQMVKDVQEFCKSCDICQWMKSVTGKKAGLMQPIGIPS